jgi:hypothetical protein
MNIIDRFSPQAIDRLKRYHYQAYPPIDGVIGRSFDNIQAFVSVCLVCGTEYNIKTKNKKRFSTFLPTAMTRTILDRSGFKEEAYMLYVSTMRFI